MIRSVRGPLPLNGTGHPAVLRPGLTRQRDRHQAIDPFDIVVVETRNAVNEAHQWIAATGLGSIGANAEELANRHFEYLRKVSKGVEAGRDTAAFNFPNSIERSVRPIGQFALGEPGAFTMVADHCPDLSP